MKVREVLAELDVLGKLTRLRPPRTQDADHAYRMIAGRREILDWLEWPGPAHPDELREQARHWRKESDDAANYQLAILRRPQGTFEAHEVVGAMSLRFVDHPDRCDLGYWIGVEHQKQGFASEAVGLATWIAFEVLGANSASACVFVPNAASRRVLEKHGFEVREEAECATTCAQRPRWQLKLERESWSARTDALRPEQYHCTFTPARP
ncbi:MAG TPA: GNAT family N-acetyltransferase [Planctomycetota bacterium]|nr:GNAT family N-acetyltransferase [Planctomycetota bacterium]